LVKDIDKDKAIELIKAAKGVEFTNILKKLKAGKTLTAHDRKVLEEYEENVKGQQGDGKGKTKKTVRPGHEFNNPKEVAEYLNGIGYKVSQRTVYRHAREKDLLKKNNAGIYTLKAVKDYAKAKLKKVGARQSEKDEGLQRQIMAVELESREADLQLKRLKLMKEQGLTMSREEHYQDLAGKIAVIEDGLKSRSRARAGERISLVKGDPKMTGELIKADYEIIDERMNELATDKEHRVILKRTENASR